MTAALLYPHIDKQQGDVARLQRIPRVRVAQIVMDYLAHGWSPDEMCRQHPYLRPAEVHAAMIYYYDHQEEIDSEIKAEWEQARREKGSRPPSPFFIRMRAQGLL
jgi:IS30 family transposase